MSKYDFPTQFGCNNRNLYIKIEFFDSVRMSKWDFECQNYYFLTQFEFDNRILNIKIKFFD